MLRSFMFCMTSSRSSAGRSSAATNVSNEPSIAGFAVCLCSKHSIVKIYKQSIVVALPIDARAFE